MIDWPHQVRGVEGVAEAFRGKAPSVCLTAPTGMGKSIMAHRIVEWGHPTLLLCHRSMLMEQWAEGFLQKGFDFGMQASGWAPGFSENLQVGMLQTVIRRWEAGQAELPYAEIVIIDEIHAFTGATVQALIEEYINRGAFVVLITATPVGIGHLTNELVVAGYPRDGIKCGALIPARHVAPDEPDYKCFQQGAPALLQLRNELKETILKVICGRVLDHYKRLNPEQRPAILFAPGVEESLWFTEQFNAAGIPWSHIDADVIVLNGVKMNANRENRKRLMEASRTGETKGISSRFVMREGIDAPWLYHGILACTVSGLSAYLQMIGRLLRAYPGMENVIIQDHGGNYHRHGSCMAPREWSLEDTDAKIRQKRMEALRNGKEREPVVCPKCNGVRSDGAVCPYCGFAYRGKRRMVIQTDGTLKEVFGDIYYPRKVCVDPDAHRQWRDCVYACKNSGRTFTQARGLFMKRNRGQVPGPDFPLMPINEADWGMRVADVPMTRMTGYGSQAPPASKQGSLFATT